MKLIKGSKKEIEIKAVNIIVRRIRELLKTKDNVVLGIPGGKSVSGILDLLKSQKIPWQKIHIFMIDERPVPLTNSESNFGQAKKIFLDYLTEQYIIPKQNTHPYIYYNLEGNLGTKAYKRELRKISDSYDIAILSAGEDSHIASLFPNHESIKNFSEFFINVANSPKPPKKRMSASKKLLQKSQTAILLFMGEEKRDALNKFLDNRLSINECPAKLINEIRDSYALTDIN